MPPIVHFLGCHVWNYPAYLSLGTISISQFSLTPLRLYYLVIHWVTVGYCQRIHIIACISVCLGAIATSLGGFYMGILTLNHCAFVQWYFNFRPLSNWVTGDECTEKKKKPRRGRWKTSHNLSEEQLQMNTSPPPVVATQNNDTVLLLSLHFLIPHSHSIQLKMKAEEVKMERFGNGLLAVIGRKKVSPLSGFMSFTIMSL